MSRQIPCVWRYCNVWENEVHTPMFTLSCSQRPAVFLGSVKSATPFPIFATLFSSSIGAKKKASNRNGGKLT